MWLFFSYSLLSGRENKRREKDEDRCGITADCQKPGNDEPTIETKKKKGEKKMMILFSREEIVYEMILGSYCPIVSNIFFQHFLPTHIHISLYIYVPSDY